MKSPTPIASPRPQAMWRPRRSFALLLFLPTSPFVLALLVLACNSLRLLCLTRSPAPTQSFYIPHSPSLLAAVREETTRPSKTKSHQNKTSSGDSFNGFSRPNSSSSFSPLTHGRKPWRMRKSALGFLRSNARTRLFSARAAKFFNGYPNPLNSSCKPQFFMTWISPLESLGPRELLSMESLFNSHPQACLLILSNTMDSTRGKQLLKPFVNKGFRAAAMSPDLVYLFRNTAAKAWLESLRRGTIHPGEVSLAQNLSNLLRLVVLFKFGGVYIDTDVIIMKSFSGLKNAIGAQSIHPGTGNWTRLNNAVMIFDRNHPLLRKFIEEFAATFDGNKWGHNGPYLVSRVASRVMGQPGFDFTVLPPDAFYPVDWNRMAGLFQRPRDRSQSKWVSEKFERIRRESFALHLWNRQSKELEVEQGSVIGRIMADRCLFCNSSAFAL